MLKKHRTSVAMLAICFAVVASGSATAETLITYDPTNRPVLFQNLQLDGLLYTVSVTWDSNYDTVYASETPMFLGDESGAITARSSLSQALVSDGYTATTWTNYLCVPYRFDAGTPTRSKGLDLNYGPSQELEVDAWSSTNYGFVGYTVWSIQDAVGVESGSWGTVKALFRP